MITSRTGRRRPLNRKEVSALLRSASDKLSLAGFREQARAIEIAASLICFGEQRDVEDLSDYVDAALVPQLSRHSYLDHYLFKAHRQRLRLIESFQNGRDVVAEI